MSLTTTRQQRRALKTENLRQPAELRKIPEAAWPSTYQPPGIREVWRSQEFLVQVFAERDSIERMSVCRTAVQGDRWLDGIGWDDLQRLKTECGRGDKDAVEIYPANADVVNVANMRHLWIVPSGIPFKWTK